MKSEKLYQLIKLAEELSRIYSEDNPTFKKVSAAIETGVEELLKEFTSDPKSIKDLNKRLSDSDGNLYVPGDVYVGGELTILYNKQKKIAYENNSKEIR